MLQLAVKREIFKPTFLNFPFLDLFPIPSRKRARRLADTFTNELCRAVLRGHRHGHVDPPADRLGCRMVQAYESRLLTERQFQDNMTSVFLAGHENPQLLLVSLIYLLGQNQVCDDSFSGEMPLVFSKQLPNRGYILGCPRPSA